MTTGKLITIESPNAATILAARHLDATEGPVRTGSTVDTATRSAITQVLNYVSAAHNSPPVEKPCVHEQALGRVRALFRKWLADGPPRLGESLARWWDRRLIEMDTASRLPSDGTGDESGWWIKKPLRTRAVQVRWTQWNQVCELLGDALVTENPGGAVTICADEASDTCGEEGPTYISFNVRTIHGETAVVRHGDWIIPESAPGRFYPVKPDVFARTYDPATGAEL